MEFQKIDTFFGETCSWDLSATSCHTSTFIDIANIFLANRRSVKTICTVSGSNSSHMDVTGPMNFEKKLGPFFAKSCYRDFAATICHPSTFLDLANTALAKRRSVNTICLVSGRDSTHMVVTSPVNSKQPGSYFRGNSWSRNFAVPICHPSTLIDLSNTALVEKQFLKTICTV